MVEKVLLAVNGGAGSNAALNWVLERSRTTPLSLELTTVIEIGRYAALVPEEHLTPAYERTLVDAKRRVALEAPSIKLMTSIRRGAPQRELLRASANADLLVVGTREPTGYFSGTLRHQLAAGARCPVAVVPANWEPRQGAVVTGVDDDDTSQLAAAFAAREADRLRSDLVVVHGWQIPVVLAAHWLSMGADPYVEIRKEHDKILDRSVEKIRATHPGMVVRAELVQGSVSLALVEFAEHAELLVVGTHRRGVIPGLLLGSVAHDVLTTMPCPIIIVPHPEESPLRVSNAQGDMAP